jgi:hypothetical protein
MEWIHPDPFAACRLALDLNSEHDTGANYVWGRPETGYSSLAPPNLL